MRETTTRTHRKLGDEQASLGCLVAAQRLAAAAVARIRSERQEPVA